MSTRLICTLLFTIFALVRDSAAHYNFDKLIVNGTPTKEYEYIRRMTNSNGPILNVKSTDMRCNHGTQANAAATKTHPIKAGDKVGFTIIDVLGHQGPLFVYLSKAPGEASKYDGSGDWFKIYSRGVKHYADYKQGLVWEVDNWKRFEFELPKTIPNGEYLMRVEHIALHDAGKTNGAQFYISCAQISVTGGQGGSPKPLVRIPGLYSANDPGIRFNPYWPPVKNYTMPGPEVYR